jgi:hypothetical protein
VTRKINELPADKVNDVGATIRKSAPAMQYHLQLIERQYAGSVIEQRASDGYINATAMSKAALKLFSQYNRLDTTQAFLKVLSANVQIHTLELIQIVKSGDPELQGTWVHPRVAVHLAQWLSPDFAVLVSGWVFDWMSGKMSGATQRPGNQVSYVFAQRYHLNSDRVDQGYFSVIGELYVRLYAKLEHAGYVLPDKGIKGKELRPDVSVGRTFATWVDDKYPEHASRWKTYTHLFPNGQEVPNVRQYENIVLPAFIEFVENEWIPHRAEEYLRTRDPVALQFLPKLLPAPSRSS